MKGELDRREFLISAMGGSLTAAAWTPRVRAQPPGTMTSSSITLGRDSGNVGGLVDEIAVVTHPAGGSGVVTAVQTADSHHRLKLIHWRADDSGIVRLGDSGNQAGGARGIDIARAGSRLVTVCETNPGQLKLISWDVTADSIVRRGDSGNQTGGARLTHVAVLSEQLAVTGCATTNGNLKLISWRIGTDGSFARLADSGSAAGRVHWIALLPLPDEGYGTRVLTAVSDSERNLKLIVWRVTSTGQITRVGDSGGQAGWSSHIRAVLHAPGLVVTSVMGRPQLWPRLPWKNYSGRLKLITWRVSPDGRTITRLHDSGDGEECWANALIDRPYGVLSAIRNNFDSPAWGGLLQLFSWTVGADGTITPRNATQWSQGPAVQQVAMPREVVSGSLPVVTAVMEPDWDAELDGKTEEGDEKIEGFLQLVSWSDL
jgi:hypothetical protein